MDPDRRRSVYSVVATIFLISVVIYSLDVAARLQQDRSPLHAVCGLLISLAAMVASAMRAKRTV